MVSREKRSLTLASRDRDCYCRLDSCDGRSGALGAEASSRFDVGVGFIANDRMNDVDVDAETHDVSEVKPDAGRRDGDTDLAQERAQARFQVGRHRRVDVDIHVLTLACLFVVNPDVNLDTFLIAVLVMFLDAEIFSTSDRAFVHADFGQFVNLCYDENVFLNLCCGRSCHYDLFPMLLLQDRSQQCASSTQSIVQDARSDVKFISSLTSRIKTCTIVLIGKGLKGLMPRKNKKDTQKWWEQKLRALGLSMEKGRNRKLTYVGTGTDLEFVAGKRAAAGKRKETE